MQFKKLTYVCAISLSAAVLSGCGGKGGDEAGNVEDNEVYVTGTFTDDRDGRTYRTVEINGQIWMAENLNYQIPDNGWCGGWFDNSDASGILIPESACAKYSSSAFSAQIGSWCYNNDISNCAKYGRLYTWNAATGACPAGWHLPNINEWTNLGIFAGGGATYEEKLRAKPPVWDGTDDFGFSAMPGGFRRYDGSFDSIGEWGSFWERSQIVASIATGRSMITGYGNRLQDYYRPDNGYSVRCVRYAAASGAAERGSFTDARDGKEYRTVKIGKRTWMAENLNYRTDSSLCYDGDASNCAKYGRLYDWNTAMSACPAGWRLPTRAEWSGLVNSVGYFDTGAKLKSESPDWDGTDDYGFSAMPGGHLFPEDRGYGSLGSTGIWWTATQLSSDWPEDSSKAYTRTAGSSYAYLNEFNAPKSSAFSVRCLRD
jgi:uncharacterized protein (TIGR02145 family)